MIFSEVIRGLFWAVFLKEELYKRNSTYDLLWVWFALNRQKQRGIKRDI